IKPRSPRLHRRDPRVNPCVERVQRQRPRAEHLIVERANIEFAAERRRRVRAQLFDLQLADLVGERLARPYDVAIDFHGDVMLRLPGIGLEVVDGVLARPPHRMDAGVEDEADGTPHLVGELPEFAVRIFVETELVAETLAVESPTLNERRVATVPPELRHSLLLLSQRDLEVMPR